MAKFKVGDLVELVQLYNPTNGQEEHLHKVGKIVDVDEEWVYPYEVDFDNENLYCDVELKLVELTVTPANPFLNIKFQEGTVEENGVNGTQIEDVIDLLVERLNGFQKGAFPCRENALAITKLEEARMWLNERTRKRKEQGVEGKNEKHV